MSRWEFKMLSKLWNFKKKQQNSEYINSNENYAFTAKLLLYKTRYWKYP